MSSIADSDAAFDADRMFAQHHTAVTILQGILSNPEADQVRWLDLACGRGQIIAHLQKNLRPEERAKLILFGYDIDNDNTRHAQKLASSLDLRACDFAIGELSEFYRDNRTKGPWDFITLTNTVHEISPKALSAILVGAIERLSETGCLFVYDMDRLSTPELGAVLWTGPEASAILGTLCEALGCTAFKPPVGTWPHSSCNGWNANIQRSHMQLPPDWRNRLGDAVHATSHCIETVLRHKRAEVSKALEGLTRFGPETEKERKDKEKLLYDFWAISRALGVHK
jgi:SAM-dependent methyltransferase